jgi:hypothetical protein
MGSGAEVTRNVPTVPFTPNPALFDQMTSRNHHVPLQVADPGDNASTAALPLPPANILAWITITFDGEITTVHGTGTITTGYDWPYGLLSRFGLSANFQNDIITCRGDQLHVHRFATNPSFVDGQDVFPGTVGGGDVLTDGTYSLHLTWQVPVVMDKTSLIGALYLQSAQNVATVQLTRKALLSTTAGAALLVGTNNAAATMHAGTFTIALDSYDVPRDPESGAVITPDLSRLHGLNQFPFPLTNTGDSNVPLVKVNGQLVRLFVQVKDSLNSVLDPKASAASGWNQLRLEYGGNKSPQAWDLASLVAKNNEQYGAPLPYGYVCIDNVRENPVRDSVLFQGVTDLRAVVNLDAAVSLGANAEVNVLEETLYM